MPPIEIKSVLSKKTGMVIRGTDLGNMQPLNLVITDKTPGVTVFSEHNDPEAWIAGHINAYLPVGAKFVPLPETITKIAEKEHVDKILDAKLATVMENNIPMRKEGGAYYVSNAGDLYQYPEEISAAMKEASFTSYTGKTPLTEKEARFALRIQGSLLEEDALGTIKEGQSVLVPAKYSRDVTGMPEALMKGAELKNLRELPQRYKEAARDLRLNIETVMDVITVAPHLKKFAEEILPSVLDKSDIYSIPVDIQKKTARFKGADYEDKPTLDDMFELGFLNDKNLKYFIEKEQDLEELEDFLCKVLMTTRIAGFGMEEESAQNALYGVSELGNVLKRINFKVHGSD